MKKGKIYFRQLILALILLLFPIRSFASPKIPEKPQNYYLDQLGILDRETRENIQKTNRELGEKTGSHVAVLTFEDLEGEDPASFGTEVFNQWKIGDKEKENGVLILFAKDSSDGKRHINIITGYGIEGALNDGKVGRIIDDYMMDYFSDGDYSKGIDEGFNAVVSVICKEYGVELSKNYDGYDLEDGEESDDSEISPLGVIIFLIFLYFFFNSGGGGGRRRYYRSNPRYRSSMSGGSDFRSGSSGSGSGFGSDFGSDGGSSGGGGAGRSF